MDVLYIDDDPLSLLFFEEVASQISEITSFATLSSGSNLLNICKSRKTDFVFLDIEMPDFSGLLLANELRRSGIPVVFLTNHKDYAFDAFGVNALNFVLKPITKEKILDSIQRIPTQLDNHPRIFDSELKKILESVKVKSKQFIVRERSKLTIINPDSILYFEASGSYAIIHNIKNESIITSRSLKNIEFDIRKNPNFIKIHRSYIVNIIYLESVFSKQRISYVKLKTGVELELSANIKDTLITKLLENSFDA